MYWEFLQFITQAVCFSGLKKKKKTCKEREKWVSSIQGEEANDRNCLWEGPDWTTLHSCDNKYA